MITLCMDGIIKITKIYMQLLTLVIPKRDYKTAELGCPTGAVSFFSALSFGPVAPLFPKKMQTKTKLPAPHSGSH